MQRKTLECKATGYVEPVVGNRLRPARLEIRRILFYVHPRLGRVRARGEPRRSDRSNRCYLKGQGTRFRIRQFLQVFEMIQPITMGKVDAASSYVPPDTTAAANPAVPVANSAPGTVLAAGGPFIGPVMATRAAPPQGVSVEMKAAGVPEADVVGVGHVHSEGAARFAFLDQYRDDGDKPETGGAETFRMTLPYRSVSAGSQVLMEIDNYNRTVTMSKDPEGKYWTADSPPSGLLSLFSSPNSPDSDMTADPYLRRGDAATANLDTRQFSFDEIAAKGPEGITAVFGNTRIELAVGPDGQLDMDAQTYVDETFPVDFDFDGRTAAVVTERRHESRISVQTGDVNQPFLVQTGQKEKTVTRGDGGIYGTDDTSVPDLTERFRAAPSDAVNRKWYNPSTWDSKDDPLWGKGWLSDFNWF